MFSVDMFLVISILEYLFIFLLLSWLKDDFFENIVPSTKQLVYFYLACFCWPITVVAVIVAMFIVRRQDKLDKKRREKEEIIRDIIE